MTIGVISIKLHLPWVHSLKEKRMVVKSLCAKIKNKFNVSIAEVEEQDIHQIAVFGIAAVTTDHTQANRILEQVINYMESNTEGNIISVEREII